MELGVREAAPPPPPPSAATPAENSGANPGAVALDWGSVPTVTPAGIAPRTQSDFSTVDAQRAAATLRRRRRLFAGGMAIILASGVLGIALIWPEGPQRGSIEVLSTPPGATVRIDGTVLSKLTPIRVGDVELHQPHHLAVSLRGYDMWESDAKFEGSEREIRLQATLVSSVGTIEIDTAPPGAEAIVNGRISGMTPVRVGDLPPNEDVTVELRLRGYKVANRTVQWNGKRSVSVSVPLEKAY
jgi:hypothetical protein